MDPKVTKKSLPKEAAISKYHFNQLKQGQKKNVFTFQLADLPLVIAA